MERFRHKTAKKSFQNQYYASVGMNVLGCAALIHPKSREVVARELKRRRVLK